jgi:hypothetical protein
MFMLRGVCHGLRLSCLMGNRASPLVRCDYPSCTSAVYSHSCIPTVRSITQFNLSSILQFFLHTRCSHTGTGLEDAMQHEVLPHLMSPFLRMTSDMFAKRRDVV